jgi:predicted TIM-barrel fold metal-dependent hydrolase
MRLLDTHQHLEDLRPLPCSWCAGIPALNRSFLLADYTAAALYLASDEAAMVTGSCLMIDRGVERRKITPSLSRFTP